MGREEEEENEDDGVVGKNVANRERKVSVVMLEKWTRYTFDSI